jgi:hypothetical protein
VTVDDGEGVQGSCAVVRRDGRGVLAGEEEQVEYLSELVEEFNRIELAAAFWFSFAGFALPHRPDDPEHDLDLSSYGLVAVDDDGHWEPKQVFGKLAALNE